MQMPVLGQVLMEAGSVHDIRIDYQEDGGDAGLILVWQSPSDMAAEPTIVAAVQAAQKADVVILCVGNSKDFEGEGRDVQGFDLPRDQDLLVQAVLSAGKPTIVVLYGGTPFRIEHWAGKAAAILNAYYPGQEGGEALAKILFGDVNPSGKLPYSYIQSEEQSPGFANYMNADLRTPYAEDVFVGYKWYQAHDVQPLYPFGYGLSYTNFEYSDLNIEKLGDHRVRVRVNVHNTGTRAGEEVVQLYVGQDNAPVARPARELRGFAKIALEAGETGTATIELDERAFRRWDNANGWTIDADSFTIQVGTSSADILLKGMVDFKQGR